MNLAFYLAGAVSAAASLLAVTRRQAIHGLLYFVVSVLALAVVFFVLGAPFAATLEVIIYAGAIMVLFVFVVMMLNLEPGTGKKEGRPLSLRVWLGPAGLSLVLLAELIYIVASGGQGELGGVAIGPKAVGLSLFGKYAVGVELVAFLLLGGIIGAYHLGWHEGKSGS